MMMTMNQADTVLTTLKIPLERELSCQLRNTLVVVAVHRANRGNLTKHFKYPGPNNVSSVQDHIAPFQPFNERGGQWSQP